ncbi:MAG: methionine synthase, partial [Leptospiraceae bacterium]|nr:methionine synthase [Leptospiraceae bacterium]
LITPSLDEMVHVASEMERLGIKKPLLIGGATTSKIHTAVKIGPSYSGTTIHVLDASRSVPVVQNLLSKEHRENFVEQIKQEYKTVRSDYANRSQTKEYLTLEDARANATQIDFTNTIASAPAKPGLHHIDDMDLAVLRDYIDWGPFFIAWEMKGKYPAILDDEKYGTEARKLFADANKLLDRIIDQKLLKARAVFGLFPAGRSGSDDIQLYKDDNRKDVLATFHTLRQQTKKRAGEPNRALADYVAPPEAGADHMGAFAVTTGIGIDSLIAEFEKAHDDYNSIMTKALADRLAEAFAEYLHERVRKDYWGYAPDENLSNAELVREKYRGIRPAPGYPAQPDHTEKDTLFQILSATEKTGIELTESKAMWPAASVCGLYFAHPEAKYFGLGNIAADQLEDYARRKGKDKSEMEKWLRPNLNYDA